MSKVEIPVMDYCEPGEFADYTIANLIMLDTWYTIGLGGRIPNGNRHTELKVELVRLRLGIIKEIKP